MKLIDPKQAKEFASTFFGDPILQMAANAVLDNVPTIDAMPMAWIPVAERLPEQGQEVIVYCGGVLAPKVYAYCFWNKDYDSWARVTHWMALPEPPEVQHGK